MKRQDVRVHLGERSYDIAIGEGLLADAAAFLLGRGKATHAVIVTDANVEKPHAIRAAESLGQRLKKVDLIVVEPGETTKSIASASALWEGLLELGADRKTVVVAVGGGVVGDLSGFVAATYARGVRFLQAPTTLLAQVDSSVGGKVGVNLPAAKNMVGAFLQPMGVLIDLTTLQTLPAREYAAGLAEVVKYGIILDGEFFDELEAAVGPLRDRDLGMLAGVVARSCRLKADVVEKDEREETGLRAVLNYGHTFGHAFESLSGYGTLLHGEAVAMGMIAASRLAERMGRIDAEATQRQRRLLAALDLPTEPPKLAVKDVLAAMRHDKKTEDGRLRLVLPSRIGAVDLVDDVPADEVTAVLEGD